MRLTRSSGTNLLNKKPELRGTIRRDEGIQAVATADWGRSRVHQRRWWEHGQVRACPGQPSWDLGPTWWISCGQGIRWRTDHEDFPTRTRKGSRETMAKMSRLGCLAFGCGPCSLCRAWRSWQTSLQNWLDPAQKSHPDCDYELLADSGDFRFQSIGSKLPIALQNMVANAGEVASEVKIYESGREVRSSERRVTSINFLMGRKIFAMMLGHFRTTPRDETLFNAGHLYKLRYRVDKATHNFLNAWLEIIANMKPEDIPSIPFVIISSGNLTDPQRWMWTSSSSKVERRRVIRRLTRSCWTLWNGTLQGFEKTRAWHHRLHDPWKTERSSSEACCSSTWQGWWQELWWQGRQACRA